MTSLVKDRTEIYQKYQNRWIAMADDERIISEGATFEEAFDKAVKKGHRDPFVIRIPDLKFDYLL